MREAGYTGIIEEPFDTFRENAFQKAKTLWDWGGMPVLADDSGICVDTLDGAPGVYSARYAGEGATDEANNEQLLRALAGSTDRAAHYYAVLCLILDGQPHYFEGRCDGRIAMAPSGGGGFGYDPLFIPDGYSLTFGALDAATKGRISHRAKALQALLASGLLG